MPSLAERQGQFARALLDPQKPLPAGLSGPPGFAPADRFAVYRNNVAVGLIEALRAAFPVVNRLVGDEFFTAMARAHALQCPPSSPVLLAYGADFPAFVADFEPARSLPYLADVARLERSWLDAYHEAEADPLAIGDLQGIPAERLPGLCLRLHPSARFLSLQHSALSVWRHHQAEGQAGPLELDDAPEEVLVIRPGAWVETVAAPRGACVFGEVVRAGGAIAAAGAAALDAQPDLDLAGLLTLLFEAGAFAGLVDAPDAAPPGQGDDE